MNEPRCRKCWGQLDTGYKCVCCGADNQPVRVASGNTTSQTLTQSKNLMEERKRGVIVCWMCEGTGKIRNDGECMHCDGTGARPQPKESEISTNSIKE